MYFYELVGRLRRAANVLLENVASKRLFFKIYCRKCFYDEIRFLSTCIQLLMPGDVLCGSRFVVDGFLLWSAVPTTDLLFVSGKLRL